MDDSQGFEVLAVVSVTTDGLHAASEHARSWAQAVERAKRGETVAVLAHTRHVADVVPSGEIERLRETIDGLSDNDLLRELRSGLDDLRVGRVVSAADVAADLRRRSAQQWPSAIPTRSSSPPQPDEA